MELKLAIFPYRVKFPGLLLMIVSLPFGYLYFFGGKPEIFNVKVFAVVTNYLETRYFVISQTNILDELFAVFFIAGITLFSFSKEKTERENYETLRMKAIIYALFSTILIWLLAFVFIYGMAIFIVSFAIFLVFIVVYNIYFRYFVILDRRKNKIS